MINQNVKTKKLKTSQTWSISKFSEQNSSSLKSKEISFPSYPQISFYLQYYPKGIGEKQENPLIRLVLDKFDQNGELEVKATLSIRGPGGKEFNLKETSAKLNRTQRFYDWEGYLSNQFIEEKKSEFLIFDKLVLCCTIEVQQLEVDDPQLLTLSEINDETNSERALLELLSYSIESFSAENSSGQNETIAETADVVETKVDKNGSDTEISSNIKSKKHTTSQNWPIKDFTKQNDCTLKSKDISLSTYPQISFHLQYYPKGINQKQENPTIRLVLNNFDQNHLLNVKLTLSIRGPDNKEFNLKETITKLSQMQQFFDWEDYLTNQFIDEKKNEFLVANKLVLCCKIDVEFENLDTQSEIFNQANAECTLAAPSESESFQSQELSDRILPNISFVNSDLKHATTSDAEFKQLFPDNNSKNITLISLPNSSAIDSIEPEVVDKTSETTENIITHNKMTNQKTKSINQIKSQTWSISKFSEQNSSSLKSKEISFSTDPQISFNLQYFPKGYDEKQENPLIRLVLDKFEQNGEMDVKLTLSIRGPGSKEFNLKETSTKLSRDQLIYDWEEYLTNQFIEESKSEFLVADKLVLCCKIEIQFETSDAKFTQPEICNELKDEIILPEILVNTTGSLNGENSAVDNKTAPNEIIIETQENKVIQNDSKSDFDIETPTLTPEITENVTHNTAINLENKSKKLKTSQYWSIKNFSKQNDSLKSPNISFPTYPQISFYLQYYPKENHAINLILDKFDQNELDVKATLSIRGPDNKEFNSKETIAKLSQTQRFCDLEKCMTNQFIEEKKSEFLVADKLILCCKIEVQFETVDTQLLSQSESNNQTNSEIDLQQPLMNSSESLNIEDSLGNNKTETITEMPEVVKIAENKTKPNLTKLTTSKTWSIKNFVEQKDPVKSPNFIFATYPQISFYLQYYPKGIDQKQVNPAIHLILNTFDQKELEAKATLSIKGLENKEFNLKETIAKLSQAQRFCEWENYLTNQSIEENKKNFLVKNKLVLCCKIDVQFETPEIQSIIIDNNGISDKINSPATPVNTIGSLSVDNSSDENKIVPNEIVTEKKSETPINIVIQDDSNTMTNLKAKSDKLTKCLDDPLVDSTTSKSNTIELKQIQIEKTGKSLAVKLEDTKSVLSEPSTADNQTSSEVNFSNANLTGCTINFHSNVQSDNVSTTVTTTTSAEVSTFQTKPKIVETNNQIAENKTIKTQVNFVSNQRTSSRTKLPKTCFTWTINLFVGPFCQGCPERTTIARDLKI